MSTDATRETGDTLKFDAAEHLTSAPAQPTCTNCNGAIDGSYHEANGNVVCAKCRATLQDMLTRTDGRGGRFVRALLFGLVGAVIGAGIYYAILALTGWEIGLIAIVVGWLVGRGVSLGSQHRGGWLYQGLAIVLTYSAIVSTYVPLVAKEGVEAPLPVLFVVAFVLPFLSGIQNIIGIAIIGFALYQAWSMNKRLTIAFTGPYQVKPAASTPAPGA